MDGLDDMLMLNTKTESEEFLNLSKVGSASYHDYLAKLTKIVSFWLENDQHKLWSVLYRMDVYESKIKLALSASKNPAESLAELILQRRIQTLNLKNKYKESKDQDPT